jgi:arylsulfatase A-like enzyme
MVPVEELDARLAEVPAAQQARAAAAAPAGICTDLRNEYCRRFQVYVAAVTSLQDTVAGLLAGLERRGLLDDTAVLLYSDHGEEFLEHWGAGAQRAADPRGFYGFGHGHTLYQEVLHVPVLAWHPAAEGREVRAGASLVDVAPTVADWLGVETPAGTFAGVSLAGSHDPRFDARLPDRPLFSSGIAFGPRQTAVVEGGWKRIVQRRPEARVLFRLAADPGEKQPVSEPRQERRLDREIGRYRNLDEPPAAAGRLGDEQLARLQALGYLTAVER